MKKRVFILFILSSMMMFGAYTQTNDGLLITPSSLLIEEELGDTSNKTNSPENRFSDVKGYNLYIKKTEGVESIMLTETTRDPDGKMDNYAYRATTWNSVNGDEKRILDGKVLDSENAKYFLIDSTVEYKEGFGECFHIYIPSELVYGYSWSRNGSVKIGRGTFINIRAFSKKYCDYTGEYKDNPFMFNLEVKRVKKPVKTESIPTKVVEPETKNNELVEHKVESDEVYLTDDYSPEAVQKFGEISDFMIYSKGPETIVDDIMNSMNRINPKACVDVVFAIDATGSMKDDIEKLRKEWVPRLLKDLEGYGDVRLALVLYRDYGDNFYTKSLPVKYFDFTSDIDVFIKNLNGFKIRGNEGGDIPEAVYEALYASMDFVSWRKESVKKVILIGDAEPHPKPRGSQKYTKQLIEKMSKDLSIGIDAIITPDDKSRRGR